MKRKASSVLLLVAVLSGGFLPYPDPECLQTFGLMALVLLLGVQPLRDSSPPETLWMGSCAGWLAMLGGIWLHIRFAGHADCTPWPLPIGGSLGRSVEVVLALQLAILIACRVPQIGVLATSLVFGLAPSVLPFLSVPSEPAWERIPTALLLAVLALLVVAHAEPLTLPGRFTCVGIVLVNLLLFAIAPACLLRERGQGQLTACKSNLKTLGTALELYAADHRGAYPRDLEHLTPDYLKALPTCPAAGRCTYRDKFVSTQEAYTFCCSGCHHHNARVRYPDFPAYNSRDGLVFP